MGIQWFSYVENDRQRTGTSVLWSFSIFSCTIAGFADGPLDREAERRTGMHTFRQTDRDRQTDKRTDRLTE